MADNSSDNPDSLEASADENASVGTAASATYKVLGEFTDASGAGVLGKNNAGSGTPIGVEGAVPNTSGGYGLSTPHDARIEGVLDTDETDFVLEAGTTATNDATNVVHGHASNGVTDGAIGATIGGGGFDDGSTIEPNRVHDNYGTVAGGRDNEAGDSSDDDPTLSRFATVGGGRDNTASAAGATVAGGTSNAVTATHGTVGGGEENTASGATAIVGGGEQNTASRANATIGGGWNNTASGFEATVGGGINNEATASKATVGGGSGNEATASDATVGGGDSNTASGRDATVPGGRVNTAGGDSAFAAGEYAAADDDNAFVWNDGSGASDGSGSQTDQFSSATSDSTSSVVGSNTVNVKTTSGIRIITAGDNSAVTWIPGGSAGWSSSSTRTAKTNVDPVDPEAVLDDVEAMSVSTWEFADEDGTGRGVRHIGPMAEDFHDAFEELGASETAINAINADGVALAAIQGLAERLAEKDERIEAQADRIEELEERVATLETRTTTEPRADD